MSKKNTTCDCTGKEACYLCEERIFKKIERSVPKLSYDIMQGGLKHLQGQILTLIEATVPSEKLVSTKSLVKNFFNDKLTLWFDWYGETSTLEIPDYEVENSN